MLDSLLWNDCYAGGLGFGFADGVLEQVDADDGGAGEAAGDGGVEVGHVLGQEALADEAQGFGLFGWVGNECGAPHGDG